jgi:hypothetical protein
MSGEGAPKHDRARVYRRPGENATAHDAGRLGAAGHDLAGRMGSTAFTPYPCALRAMPAKLASMRRELMAASVGWALTIPALLWGADALAAPFAGTGHAAISGEVDGLKARDQALERARKAALEAAIQQIGAADPAARKQVLAAPTVWTRSYRVLKQDDDGATATAMVSVEIDTAKLSKALAAPGAPATGPGPGLTVLPGLELRSDGCPPTAEADLKKGLLAAGLIRDVAAGSAGPVLSASLKCDAVGTVGYPRQTVVRADLQLQAPATRPDGAAAQTRASATGFGEDAQAAASDAFSGLIGQVTKAMSGRTGTGVRLKIAAPWPAARVRRLERALRDSVVGVQSVAVAGVGSDGAITLRIEGGLSAQELHARLPGVQVPGATLVVGEVESSNVVHISLQASSAPAP